MSVHRSDGARVPPQPTHQALTRDLPTHHLRILQTDQQFKPLLIPSFLLLAIASSWSDLSFGFGGLLSRGGGVDRLAIEGKGAARQRILVHLQTIEIAPLHERTSMSRQTDEDEKSYR